MDRHLSDLDGDTFIQSNHLTRNWHKTRKKSASIKRENYVIGKMQKNRYVFIHLQSHIHIHMYIFIFVYVYLICLYQIIKVACLIQILCADDISQTRLY